MTKEVNCQCQTGCDNKRCSCHKRFEACDQHCECSGCENPYNDVNPEEYVTCALDHIKQVKELTEEEREETHELPCGDRSVKRKQLLDMYECPDCGSYYWYSFCRNRPEPDSETWHCEHCGKDGPMADMTEL